MKKIFSGIQPSGVIHLGNYLGAIKQWVELQDEATEAKFCIVDLHAITVPQDPKILKKNILSVAALYLACGVDPKKSNIFVQSARPEHAELGWLLNTITKMGELSRMTQFKDKSQKGGGDLASVGLFDYPVLMAADILLYGATHIPVGHDQKQHVELARDLATRFNSQFGDTFTVPEPIISGGVARIMGLDDPMKKMSKSADSVFNYIAMTDDPDTIRQKVKKAVTDSGNEVKIGPDKPAVTNLLNIYSSLSSKSVAVLEEQYSGKTYGEFKSDLADVAVNFLAPIQKKYNELIEDDEKLKKILDDGAAKVEPVAKKILGQAKTKMGLGV